MPNKKMTMGLIVGNRGFFPDHLAKSGREEMLRVLGAAGMDVVALTPEQSKHGAVETRRGVPSLRRFVQAKPRPHRRRDRNPSQFWGRARDRGYASVSRPARAGADPGDSR